MKFLYSLVFSSMMLASSICNGQVDTGDKQPLSMLYEFYTSYSGLGFGVEYKHKADSLHQIYCTPQLTKQAKELLQYDHELLTDDWGITNESLASLKITKDHTKENTYVVSYILDTYPVSPAIPVRKRIYYLVTVIREGETYKIASVNEE